MGYSSQNVKRVKEIFKNKYFAAQNMAETRKNELYGKLPELRELDRAIADIGLEAVHAAIGGGSDASGRIKALKKESLALQEARKRLLTENGYPSDYTNVHYECEKCSDTGYAEGRMCDCMKKALVLAGYESSGLLKLMQTQTFDSFSLDFYRENAGYFEKMKHNFEVIKSFAEGFSSSKCVNLALFGGTGLGKTHLSTAAAKTVIDRGYDVLYVTAVGMISDFEKERFGSPYSESDAEDIGRYYDADLLIIDDIGTEVTNQFTVSVLYNVINTRLSKQKSTVISTNLSPSELRARYWDRIASRIFGEYTPLLFEGTDVRMQKLRKS